MHILSVQFSQMNIPILTTIKIEYIPYIILKQIPGIISFHSKLFQYILLQDKDSWK